MKYQQDFYQRKFFLILLIVVIGIGLASFAIFTRGPSGADGGHEHTEGKEHGHDDAHSDEGENGHEAHSDHAGGHDGGHGGEEDWESVVLADSILRQSGVTLETVQRRRMAVRLPLQGKIVLNEDRAAHIHPRFPGVILEVRKRLGDRVRKGEVLAVIESNESLRPYEVVAQLEGVVVSRHASVGETVTGENEMFTIADLSTVWVDFQVYREDFNRLRVGQSIHVIAEGQPVAKVKLAYVSPSVESHSQSLLARVVLSNPDGRWTPGLFVRGEAAVDEFEAPAVRLEAVQQFPDGPVVFVREGGENRYLAHRVTLGRRDGDFVELLSHPLPGEPYVSRNSFLLKAEIGKSEASHDH